MLHALQLLLSDWRTHVWDGVVGVGGCKGPLFHHPAIVMRILGVPPILAALFMTHQKGKPLSISFPYHFQERSQNWLKWEFTSLWAPNKCNGHTKPSPHWSTAHGSRLHVLQGMFFFFCICCSSCYAVGDWLGDLGRSFQIQIIVG